MVSSPCNNVCALDDDGICISCNRTMEDIIHWGSMTEDERLERMAEIRSQQESAEEECCSVDDSDNSCC